MKIKNLNVTEYFERGKKTGFKLLAVVTSCALMATAFAGCSKEKIDHETVEIVQSQEQKTEFIDKDIEIVEPLYPDTVGMYDIVLNIGDIEIGPTYLDSGDPNDKQEATIDAYVKPVENCMDFVCTIGTTLADEDKMMESFKKYIKGEPCDDDIKFTNITGNTFTWKTDRIEPAGCWSVTKDSLDSLPEDMVNDEVIVQNVLNHIYHDRYSSFFFWDFDFFSTRDTVTYFLRYDSEFNTVLKYDLTTHIRLDSTDWKGKGFWVPFSNRSQGYENLLSDREKNTERVIHSDFCAIHPYQPERIPVLKKEITREK